jgi:hypothetical protein
VSTFLLSTQEILYTCLLNAGKLFGKSKHRKHEACTTLAWCMTQGPLHWYVNKVGSSCKVYDCRISEIYIDIIQMTALCLHKGYLSKSLLWFGGCLKNTVCVLSHIYCVFSCWENSYIWGGSRNILASLLSVWSYLECTQATIAIIFLNWKKYIYCPKGSLYFQPICDWFESIFLVI